VVLDRSREYALAGGRERYAHRLARDRGDLRALVADGAVRPSP